MDLDVLLLCMLKGLAARLMRYLLGKDDHSVRRANACLEVRRVVQDALQVHPALLGCLDIVLLQAVNAANQSYAHDMPRYQICLFPALDRMG